FDSTMAMMQPRIRGGDLAFQEMADLMGLGSIGIAPPVSAAGAAAGQGGNLIGGQSSAGASFNPYEAYVDAYPDLLAAFQSSGGKYGDKASFGQTHYQTHGQREGRRLPSAPTQAPANNQIGTPVANVTGAQAGAAPAATATPSATATPAQRQQTALERFEASPGYRFRLEQGIEALDMSAARRGALLSGREIKAVQAFGEGMAASEYGDYWNRLAGMSGAGQTAANQAIGAGENAADRIDGAQIKAGEGRASVYGAKGNVAANMWN